MIIVKVQRDTVPGTVGISVTEEVDGVLETWAHAPLPLGIAEELLQTLQRGIAMDRHPAMRIDDEGRNAL